MLDLYDFQRDINRNGVLSHNKFFVRIDPSLSDNSPGAFADPKTLRQLALRATNATFPGIHLMTQDVIRYGYGPVEKSPHNAQFSDAQTSFIVDVKGAVYQFFYKWLHSVVGFDSSNSMFPAGRGDNNNPYEVGYKDDYIADISISPTSELHNKSLTCILYKAYPIGIHEIQLDASAQNSPVLLNITWAYRDHKIQGSTVTIGA